LQGAILTNWRDNLLFYEYFHGDNGAGIGASHQTGWTGVVAGLIDIFGKLDAQTFLQGGRGAVFGREEERVISIPCRLRRRSQSHALHRPSRPPERPRHFRDRLPFAFEDLGEQRVAAFLRVRACRQFA
jgi:hypothetical protein